MANAEKWLKIITPPPLIVVWTSPSFPDDLIKQHSFFHILMGLHTLMLNAVAADYNKVLYI